MLCGVGCLKTCPMSREIWRACLRLVEYLSRTLLMSSSMRCIIALEHRDCPGIACHADLLQAFKHKHSLIRCRVLLLKHTNPVCFILTYCTELNEFLDFVPNPNESVGFFTVFTLFFQKTYSLNLLFNMTCCFCVCGECSCCFCCCCSCRSKVKLSIDSET